MTGRKGSRWLRYAVMMFLCWTFVPQVWITGMDAGVRTEREGVQASAVFSDSIRCEPERTESGWNVQGLTLSDAKGLYLEFDAPDDVASETEFFIDRLVLKTNYGTWNILEYDGRCALENPWNVGVWEKDGQAYRYTAQGTNFVLRLNDAAVMRLQWLFFCVRLCLSGTIFVLLWAGMRFFRRSGRKFALPESGAFRRWAPALFAAWLIAWYLAPRMSLPFRGDLYEINEVAKTFFLPEPQRYHSFVEYRGDALFALWGMVLNAAGALGIQGETAWRLLMGAVFVLLCAWLLPSLFEKILSRRLGTPERLCFIAVVYHVMRGYFDAPWTDTLALLFCALGMELAWRFAECLAGQKYAGKLLAYGLATTASVFLAAAFRSTFKINAVLLPLCALAFVLVPNKEIQKGKMRLIWGGACLLLAICSLGVIGIAENQSGQQSLMYSQILGGLEFQKIDYSENLLFENPIGLQMVERLGIEREELAYAEDKQGLLLRFAEAFPTEMLASVTKGVFNGLDWAYDGVVQPGVRRSAVRLVFYYSVVFSALCVCKRFLERARWKADRAFWLYGMVFAANALPYALTRVEPRFFITLVVFLIGLGVFGTASAYRDGAVAAAAQNRRVLSVSVCYILFLALCWMLHVSTYASLITKNYMW